VKELVRRLLVRLLTAGLQAQSRRYPFAPGAALVVAPHADDETLGCGGVIAAKVRRGDPVTVAYLTDSGATPAGAPASDRCAIAARRRTEAQAALRVLGVAEDAAHFLDAPDGRLHRLGWDEAGRLQRELAALLRRVGPREIFVPWLGDGSTEHAAAFWIVRDAVAAAGLHPPLVWEYPVWAWWNPLRLAPRLLRPGENFRVELGSLRGVKRAALACHRSQVEPATAPALPVAVAEACTGPGEFFFPGPT